MVKFNKLKHLMNEIEYLFSEDQGRYIVEIESKNLKEVTKVLSKNSVYFEELGVITDKDMIAVIDKIEELVRALRKHIIRTDLD